MKDANKLIINQILQIRYNEMEYWKRGEGCDKIYFLDPDITKKCCYFFQSFQNFVTLIYDVVSWAL